MLSEKLLKAYNAHNYEKLSATMQAVLKSYLETHTTLDNAKTISITTPNQEYDFWNSFVAEDESHLFNTLVDRSIKLHNRKYIGHQVAVPLPITAVISEMTALLNNGMAVYEMGAAATAIEKVVVDQLKHYFGYDHVADGFFTSGGSIANLTAMLCARSTKIEVSWLNGTQYNQYAIMVSEQAHYCIDRAVKIMGWGENGCIKIPVDANYKIRTDLLTQYYEEATSRGVKIIGIVGSAPSTSTGMYDDLQELGQFALKHELWYHVDAAHGGPAAFTDKYSYLLKGIEMADSITIDCHKMMMTPALTTMLLFKKGKDSFSTFSQQAQYLWADQQEEWHNLGKRTIECTKLMMAMRVYAVLNIYGIDIISEYVIHTYDMARWLAEEINKSSDFELAVNPDSNIVCFRYIDCETSIVNDINIAIRQHLINEGFFYIVQTTLHGHTYLRLSIMNALTLQSDLSELLGRIRFLGQLCQ